MLKNLNKSLVESKSSMSSAQFLVERTAFLLCVSVCVVWLSHDYGQTPWPIVIIFKYFIVADILFLQTPTRCNFHREFLVPSLKDVKLKSDRWRN